MLRRERGDVSIRASHGLAGWDRVLSPAAKPIHHDSFAAEAGIPDRDTRRLFVSFRWCGCTTEIHQNILPPRQNAVGRTSSCEARRSRLCAALIVDLKCGASSIVQ